MMAEAMMVVWWRRSASGGGGGARYGCCDARCKGGCGAAAA